jgi:hypothetical protein
MTTDGPRAAIVRPPSDAFARAISGTGAALDPGRARAQHAAYRDALADLVEVVALPADEELPDACFVDDCAVVLGGRALLTRPGAPSRAAEPERLAGVLAGLVGSYALSRVMSGLLFGVTATDPLTFAASAALVLVVASVAGYVPARRAARVDPLVALRCE